MNSKTLRQIVVDAYENASMGSFHHDFLNSRVPCVAGDKRYETPQQILNRIRGEGKLVIKLFN